MNSSHKCKSHFSSRNSPTLSEIYSKQAGVMLLEILDSAHCTVTDFDRIPRFQINPKPRQSKQEKATDKILISFHYHNCIVQNRTECVWLRGHTTHRARDKKIKVQESAR